MNIRVIKLLKNTVLKDVMDSLLYRDENSKKDNPTGMHNPYPGRNWGGSNNPFNIKEAYEKFLEHKLLSSLKNKLTEDHITYQFYLPIMVRVSSYNFMSGSFKITLFINGIHLQGGDSARKLIYEYIVSKEKASEIKLPNTMLALLKVKIDPNNTKFKEALKNPKKPYTYDRPKIAMQTKIIDNEVGLYKINSTFSEESLMLSFNLSDCEKE